MRLSGLKMSLLLALCSCTQSSIRGPSVGLSSLLTNIREKLADSGRTTPELNGAAVADLQTLMGRAEEESRAARTFAARSGEEMKKKEAGVHRLTVAWRSKSMEAKRSAEVASKKEEDAARARQVAEKAKSEAAAMGAEHTERERETKDMKEETLRMMEQCRLADVELGELRLRVKEMGVSSRLTATRGVQYANRITSFGAVPLRAAAGAKNGQQAPRKTAGVPERLQIERDRSSKSRDAKRAASPPSGHHDSSQKQGDSPQNTGLLLDTELLDFGRLVHRSAEKDDSNEIVGEAMVDVETVVTENMSGGGSLSGNSRCTQEAKERAAEEELQAAESEAAAEEAVAVEKAVMEEEIVAVDQAAVDRDENAASDEVSDKKRKSKKRKKSKGKHSSSCDEGKGFGNADMHLSAEADGELGGELSGAGGGVDEALHAQHSSDGRGQESVRMRDREWSIEAEAPAVEGGVDVIGEQGVRIEGRMKKRRHKKKKRPEEFT